MVLRVATGFAARFLAKSTLFRNPISRLVMEAFGSIPIYRAHESGARSGDASRNDASFARCRAELAAGGAMALFPEGVSHSDPQLRPLKTGAARIALSTEAEHDGRLGVTLVPVGLYYERKALFRSSVLLVVGEPIDVAPLLADYRRDERQTVEALTETIDARLDEVVLQAESRDLLAGIARVARWTSDEGSQDLAAQHQRAREMADAYARLRARDPARVESDRRRGPRLRARAAPDGRPRSVGAGARAAAAGRAGGGVREVDRRRAAGRDRRGDGLGSVPAGGRGRQARDARRGRARHREAVRGRRPSWPSRGGWKRPPPASPGARAGPRRRSSPASRPDTSRSASRSCGAKRPKRGGWSCCARFTTRRRSGWPSAAARSPTRSPAACATPTPRTKPTRIEMSRSILLISRQAERQGDIGFRRGTAVARCPSIRGMSMNGTARCWLAGPRRGCPVLLLAASGGCSSKPFQPMTGTGTGGSISFDGGQDRVTPSTDVAFDSTVDPPTFDAMPDLPTDLPT